jgi:two-component system nitrogen regulation response regulator NtrX
MFAPQLLAPIGKSKIMQQLRAELQQIAGNPSSVLLIGEPGSGREAFARYLHERSPRAASTFVTLVASSLREADAENRLFGREEAGGGRAGVLEEVADGTLFIHEIEDLPPAVQRLLVGVLESGRFTRLGGSEQIEFRGRVLSSAQPGIENRAGPEGFRRDLLAHLNMLIVRTPPLRDYAEDVPELLRHYVDRVVDSEGLPFRRFSVAAQNRLRNYPWPDNVRELKTLVHRLLIQKGPEEIRLEEIERELAVQAPPGEPLVKQDLLALPLREAREQFERAYLQQQLLLCNGKVGQLAKRVGMERTHLYRKLRSLGVDFRSISED